jgi:hypothetical protein
VRLNVHMSQAAGRVVATGNTKRPTMLAQLGGTGTRYDEVLARLRHRPPDLRRHCEIKYSILRPSFSLTTSPSQHIHPQRPHSPA